MLNFATNIVLGPICRNRSLNDSSNPRMSAVMLTIDVMPMTTPRIVNAERILFARSVSSAITRISVSRPARRPGIVSYELRATSYELRVTSCE